MRRANEDAALREIDTTVAHAARIYDFYLGGVTNFAVDRMAAEHAAAVHPGGLDTVRASVRSNRAFLVRAVNYLVGEAGVRQLLDIGSGIPSGTNVHAAAQSTAPESRIVYVDNDPVVLAHAHELKGTPEGAVRYIQGDLRDPESILDRASETLDFGRPVAVMLVGILHFFPPADDPYGIVGRLVEAVPSGSFLTICHLASDIHAEEMAEVARRFNETTNETWFLRSNADLARFFHGLHLVEPGVVQVDHWRPHEGPEPVLPLGRRVNPLHVGVAHKP